MNKLENELEELVRSVGCGSGFGEPQAAEQHQREIDLLKFRITRRDNMRIAITSALIGAVVAACVTWLTALLN